MKKVALISVTALMMCSNSFAAGVTYLSCDVPSDGANPARHFDFTLNENNGTVSYYLKDVGSLNTQKAIFGPETVTWSEDGLGTRAINRTDLTFTEDVDIGTQHFHAVGTCKVTTPKARKF